MNTQLKTIFVFLFLVCTLRGTAQNFSIDYPSYQNRNSDALEISRIVRNDTATILYMDAYSRPNIGYVWLRVYHSMEIKPERTILSSVHKVSSWTKKSICLPREM